MYYNISLYFPLMPLHTEGLEGFLQCSCPLAPNNDALEAQFEGLFAGMSSSSYDLALNNCVLTNGLQACLQAFLYVHAL